MLIFPAIDVKDGACVRLLRGDYATAHKVAENILDTARAFEAAGARWVHMVDLDGAKDSTPSTRKASSPSCGRRVCPSRSAAASAT